MRPRTSLTLVATLLLLAASVVGLQAVRERNPLPSLPPGSDGDAPDIQSTEFLKRAVLSYDALASDIYWMRVVTQFGSVKLSKEPGKKYDFLYPLLDVTTSLDPDFELAYRFGAIFLAEEYPGGAGRPELAIKLLEKGLSTHPSKWEYAYDIGFVYYWWKHDYTSAADWFRRAAQLPGAANWLGPLAAVTLSEGGNRDSARRLWAEVVKNASADWLAEQARFRLLQLDALDQIDALERVVQRYRERTGDLPYTWAEMVRAGVLRGVPVDPRRFPYVLNPYWGTVTLSPESTLAPLPGVDRVRQ